MLILPAYTFHRLGVFSECLGVVEGFVVAIPNMVLEYVA
jgi:hypothetical protein